MYDRIKLSRDVKAEAARLGFSLVGITSPDPPATLPVFTRWLESGFHGEMSYLASDRARQRRADPRLILPECRSILVLGLPYFANRGKPGSSRSVDRLAGKVASYAWGKDYHEILPARLRALVEYLEARAGQPVSSRWYTDTGPLLERELAWRAGLGWIGKNTCLIHPRQGSYFFLAEILLGIELEADSPLQTDFCGSCTRCLDACPTSCILPNRTLDARRCISYLTIELKGTIPGPLRAGIDDWVFGCDVCQQVCPWNQRFAPVEGDAAFAPRRGVPLPDLVKELELTSNEFAEKFKGSPVKRARLAGYLRNVAVALGNQAARMSTPRSSDSGETGTGQGQRSAAVRALTSALAHPDPLVRMHAAWALGEVGGSEASRALVQAVQHETDQGVIVELEKALHRVQEAGLS